MRRVWALWRAWRFYWTASFETFKEFERKLDEVDKLMKGDKK